MQSLLKELDCHISFPKCNSTLLKQTILSPISSPKHPFIFPKVFVLPAKGPLPLLILYLESKL